MFMAMSMGGNESEERMKTRLLIYRGQSWGGHIHYKAKKEKSYSDRGFRFYFKHKNTFNLKFYNWTFSEFLFKA